MSDVEDVKFVINFDYPTCSEDYVHRIGRTARSNKSGTAYTFFTPSNMKQAGDLVSVLKEANQVVNPKLFEMMEMSKTGGYATKGRSRWKGSHDIGGRGGVSGGGDKGGYGGMNKGGHRRDSSSFGGGSGAGGRSRDRGYTNNAMDRKFGGGGTMGGGSGKSGGYLQGSGASMNGYGSMNGSIGGGNGGGGSMSHMYNQYQMTGVGGGYGYPSQ